MRDKSILLIVNTLYAGAGKILMFVAEACARAGWNVTIATMYDENASDYNIEGVNFVDFGISMESRMWRIQALKTIRRNVRALKPTIVCAFVSDVVFMTRLATLGLDLFYIAAERGDPYTLPAKWVKPVKWAYSKSDYSIFQLKGAQDFFSKYVRDNSEIIPNPYTTNAVVKPYVGMRNKTVISVGRFVDQKGYDVLINAYKLFSAKHQDYKLILYGDGPLRNKLIDITLQLGLSESVLFPGFIHDVPKTICKDGMFVLSSRFEGIPNALIEAMSVGVPTISTDCSPGGPRFLTNNGQRGILISVDNVDAMANAMCYLADNEEKSQEYSRLGLEIIEELNPQTIAARWVKVFDIAWSRGRT